MSEYELYRRDLPDGRVLVVYPMLFGKARLCIGPQESPVYDDFYCYDRPHLAVEVAHVWDGEGDPPDGWIRHGLTGRRRPAGDPSREFVSR